MTMRSRSVFAAWLQPTLVFVPHAFLVAAQAL